MDIETETGAPIRQASADDLQHVLAGDFGGTLRLVRNYGDCLEAQVAEQGRFRIRFRDASSGQWQEALDPISHAEMADAFCDYFEGRWNWHGGRQWRDVSR